MRKKGIDTVEKESYYTSVLNDTKRRRLYFNTKNVKRTWFFVATVLNLL